jgi:hypothetical protein
MKACKFCLYVRALVERALNKVCPKLGLSAKEIDDLIDSIDKALAARMMGDPVLGTSETSNGSSRQSALAKIVAQSSLQAKKPDQSC